VITANQHPDYDTIANFRKSHLKSLAKLFVNVLHLCRKAGLVKLGHVSLDGTKVRANASRQKAMSYERDFVSPFCHKQPPFSGLRRLPIYT
jgi:transposase